MMMIRETFPIMRVNILATKKKKETSKNRKNIGGKSKREWIAKSKKFTNIQSRKRNLTIS